MLNEGWWPVLWFLLKLWMSMFVFVWLRGTLLRFRYDQFMRFGWKVLIPVALAWVVIVAVWQGLQQFTVVGTYDLRTWLFAGAGVLLAIALVLALLPDKGEKAELAEHSDDARRKQVAHTKRDQVECEYFDAFAGGFPVPPMPGDRKSTRLNSSHVAISYAVFCLKKKTSITDPET